MIGLPTLMAAFVALSIGGALGAVAYADQMHQSADTAEMPTGAGPMTGSGSGMMGGRMMDMMTQMTQMNQMMQTCNQMMQQAMRAPAPVTPERQEPAPAPQDN